MRSPGRAGDTLKCRTKVYDVANKKLIGVFESRKDAAKFLGVAYRSIHNYVRTKSKCRKNKLGITVAIR